MRNSIIDNYHQRTIWLEKVILGQIMVVAYEKKYFGNLKIFCGMKSDSFDVIAYNSLKSAAHLADTLGVGENSAWDKLKLLFRDAKNTVYSSTISDSPVLPSAEAIEEKTLLDAHICSMAFIELMTFLSNLAETVDKDHLYTADRIRTQLEISKVKFKSIISHTNTPSVSPPSLKLIKK
jgi:hypothetical protein